LLFFRVHSGGTNMANTPATHPWIVIAKVRVERGGRFSGLYQRVLPGTSELIETTVMATFNEFSEAEQYAYQQAGTTTACERRPLESGGIVLTPRGKSQCVFLVLYSLNTFLTLFRGEFREIRLD